ncbi:Pheromone-regulated membrane protein 10 [Nakaseomyces glabratus]|nr:Pheromone-regulated membrane protein 10 [Nakaseomyces glabratus]KTB24361.1 Pheromone-regulated membrane protein 10 [Nakaseomyces glabratus]
MADSGDKDVSKSVRFDKESIESKKRSSVDDSASSYSSSSSGQDRSEGKRNNVKFSTEDSDDEDGNLFSRMIKNLKSNGGAGLAPGLSKANSNQEKTDLEDNDNVVTGHSDDIPMEDFTSEAQNILQGHSNLTPAQIEALNGQGLSDIETTASSTDLNFLAPAIDHFDDFDGDGEEENDGFVDTHGYVAPPTQVRGGVLGSLLKLYQEQDNATIETSSMYSQSSYGESTANLMSIDSGETEVPSEHKPKDHKNVFMRSGGKVAGLAMNAPGQIYGHGSKAAGHIYGHGRKGAGHIYNQGKKGAGHIYSQKNKLSSADLSTEGLKKSGYKAKKVAGKMPKLRKRMLAEAKITVHIAELLQRQRFILRMCKALMLYGAPTHRLEEYMIMTSRVLEIDGQYLYLPGCMIVSFGDATTRTSEVQLVRCTQGLNLWKLHQVHGVYKKVIHDQMGADEGNIEIDRILREKNLYPPWVCVFLYGFCSAMVTPYAFGGHWINLAITFFMGSCVGMMQFILSEKSLMYSNVFEITASIVVSFCGRAFGSIPNSNICFGAITQGSLALILPGYIILCGSLELQSRSLVAGSVRMFYAIIYSLFLGFGITLGAALFGWMYKGATNEISCGYPISPWFRFLFVPAFTIGISLINQANWTQLPAMVFISCTGYVVTYWSGKHFQNSTEFTAALASFVIGILGNLYSRIWQGLAVSAMLPAIFVQVPSGIASQNSLLSGLQSANQIVGRNGTNAVQTVDLSNSMSFGITMIEVSIGISVGLFASTLCVYPFGKKKTGLFSL